MQAKDIMTKNPYATGPENTIYEVLWTMTDSGIRHVPVVREGELIGILSDRDLRRFSLSMLDDPEHASEKLKRAVVDFMSSDVVSVAADAHLSEVIDLLIENRIGALPVLDSISGDLMGIVSYVDVLRGVREMANENP